MFVLSISELEGRSAHSSCCTQQHGEQHSLGPTGIKWDSRCTPGLL